MKTWAKITIGIGTALAVVGGGFGLYKWLTSEKHQQNKGQRQGNDPNKDIEAPENVVDRKSVV